MVMAFLRLTLCHGFFYRFSMMASGFMSADDWRCFRGYGTMVSAVLSVFIA